MAEPGSYGVYIDPSTEQSDGGRVTNRMRTDCFLPQRWGRARSLCNRPLDQRVNAETGDPLTPDIEEHRHVVAPCQPCPEESAQDLDGMGPQRAEPDLAAFPEEAHGGRRAVELERSDVGLRRFGGASPCGVGHMRLCWLSHSSRGEGPDGQRIGRQSRKASRWPFLVPM